MSLPDMASGRRRSPLPDTADRVFGVGVTVIHTVRARSMWASARTGLQTIRQWRPGPLSRKDVPLVKLPLHPLVRAGEDAIDPAASTAAVVDNHERDRFDLWIGDELVGVLGYLDERDTCTDAPSDRRVVAFMHTVVAEEWTGKGLGVILAREAFAHAHSRNWTVRLVCPYAQRVLTETK